jgi:microcystin-dependent protein
MNSLIALQNDYDITRKKAGEISMYAGSVQPDNHLFCDGAEYNREDYPNLFAIIGGTYGGDGVDTFCVPDLRKTFAVHPGKRPTEVGGSTPLLGQRYGTMDQNEDIVVISDPSTLANEVQAVVINYIIFTN